MGKGKGGRAGEGKDGREGRLAPHTIFRPWHTHTLIAIHRALPGAK